MNIVADAVTRFKRISEEARFNGWPLVPNSIKEGCVIPYFGESVNYELFVNGKATPYTSIIRSFGWSVVFGVNNMNEVITLVQWKPGINKASWELPPGGIGKTPPSTVEEIEKKTKQFFLKETGYGEGMWRYMGHTIIESGKYRGAGFDDHGLKAHMFLATNLVQMTEARKPEQNEIMETLIVPLNEFRQVLSSGLMTETSAVACAYKALLELGQLKWN